MTYIFELPLYVMHGNKKISLTLNWYRNAHYHQSNKIKSEYQPIGPHTFVARQITVRYTLILCDKRRTDAQNWIAVADKFFLDWLVKNGMIQDDDCSVYSGGSWRVERDISQDHHRLLAYVST